LVQVDRVDTHCSAWGLARLPLAPDSPDARASIHQLPCGRLGQPQALIQLAIGEQPGRPHGGDREGIEASTGKDWSRIVRPQPEGIRAAAAIARSNAEKGILTIVNVNNHYEGSAPLTIERFLDQLGRMGQEERHCQ